MMNYYTMEKLIEYQQNEIELKARQMWKWLNSQHLRQTMNISTPVTVQPTAACCPYC